jgi:hypothetical protein
MATSEFLENTRKRIQSPIDKDAQPELDSPDLTNAACITKHQSLVGKAQWTASLRRFGIPFVVVIDDSLVVLLWRHTESVVNSFLTVKTTIEFERAVFLELTKQVSLQRNDPGLWVRGGKWRRVLIVQVVFDAPSPITSLSHFAGRNIFDSTARKMEVDDQRCPLTVRVLNKLEVPISSSRSYNEKELLTTLLQPCSWCEHQSDGNTE